MKLKEYAEEIAKLAKKHPDAKVVFAIDDEGNAYHEVFYTPSAGNFKNGEWKKGGKTINAVCIN